MRLCAVAMYSPLPSFSLYRRNMNRTGEDGYLQNRLCVSLRKPFENPIDIGVNF